MLIETINELIPVTAKSKNEVKLNAIKEIKNELIKEKTSGKPYTEEVERTVLIKMVKRYKDAIAEISVSSSESATKLIKEYTEQLSYISEFAPKEASNEDVINEIASCVDSIKSRGETLSMKNMKEVMTFVKAKYPTADGKLISTEFKKYL